MTVKVWGVAMEREPLHAIKVLRAHSRNQAFGARISISPTASIPQVRAPALEAHRRERPHLRQVRTTWSADVRRRPTPPSPLLSLPLLLPTPSLPLAAGPVGVLGLVRFEAAHLGRVGPDGVDAGPPTPSHSKRRRRPRRSAFGVGGAARKDSLSVFNEGPHARPPALPPPPPPHRPSPSPRVLHHSYHPQRGVVAIGAQNSLYIFSSTPDRPPPTAPRSRPQRGGAPTERCAQPACAAGRAGDALGAWAAAAPSQIPTPFSMHPASWGLFLPSTRAVDDARSGPPVDAPVPDHSQ